MLKKDKGKGQQKKYSKPRIAYITWDNDSESSKAGRSTESDEMTNPCFMTNHKKNNVSHSKHKNNNISNSKYKPIDEMCYSKLQICLENLYGEVVDDFKRLATNKRIFSYLEANVLETEKQMEALKKSMFDVSKVDVEEEKYSWFGCDTCHIWKKEVNTQKDKLNKALEPKVTFAINPTNFKRYLNVLYKKCNFVVRKSNRKSNSHHHLTCHYCCKKGDTIAKNKN